MTGMQDKNPQKLELFGTDGIRGKVGKFPLVPDFVVRLGAATGMVMQSSTNRQVFIVGRDTRQSGQMLQHSLAGGLLSAGATVIDMGVITTPGVACLVNKYGAEAGIIISASHNPVGQNGIKIVNSHGSKLSETEELEIERLAKDQGLLAGVAGRNYGRYIDGSGMRELYLDSLLDEHPDLRLEPLTIVLDCANGAASWYAPECFARIGAQLVTIHASPTGMNINRESGSEHARKFPEDLHKLIRQYSAHFAIAFDGDADRSVFVDENGNLIDGDNMLGLLADYLGRQGRLLGNTVVSTNMRNQGLVDYLYSNKVNFIETKVGDKYVTEELVKLSKQHGTTSVDLGLGGEQAGHVILYDTEHVTGDGIRTALYVVRAFLESNTPRFSEFAARIHKTPQVIASAYVNSKPDLNAIRELENLKMNIQSRLPGLARLELRYSGTEPLFRVMIESDHSHSEQELANTAWDLCSVVQRASGVKDPDQDQIEILNVTRGGIMHPLPSP
jgi:phosphoglucosamine mutase